MQPCVGYTHAWRDSVLNRTDSFRIKEHGKDVLICLLRENEFLKALFCFYCFKISVSPCESWAIKKAEHWRICCFQPGVLKFLESPLDSKEIKPVNPKGNQPWIFTGRADADAEAPILWPPDAKSQLTGKDPTRWKRPWCWGRLRSGGERDNRGWDGWMASLTQWTWSWANSER